MPRPAPPFPHARRLAAACALGLLPAAAVAAPAAGSPDDRPAGRVAAHLAAGEFGPAFEAAADAPAADRDALAAAVTAAQLAAGEYDAVAAVRGDARGRTAPPNPSLAGGAVADFTELIELIQNTTGGSDNGGPWIETEGIGGDLQENFNGVRVDPNGVMSALTREERTGRLAALGLSARVADLDADMAAPSDLRLVSLNRLERVVARCLAEGRDVPATVRFMGGLTQVTHVFLAETDAGTEVLLGGPAEGWRVDETGRPVGVTGGLPTLLLEDLVTAMRVFSDAGSGAFQCSIDPRREGIEAVRKYAADSAARGPLRSSRATARFAEELGRRMGEQDVVIRGVPADSHAARVIVEADYRMKLVGIDRLEADGVKSYFDLLAEMPSKQVPLKALRWWLTMNYDAVLHSADRTAFEFSGSSVLCQSEDEFVNGDGSRAGTGTSDLVNSRFAREFTAKYDELAVTDAAFADLRNLFDLSLAAALLSREHLPERAGWDRGVFAAGGAYQPAPLEPIEAVETAVNHRVYRGGEVVVQVAGGVRGDLLSVLKNDAVYRQTPRPLASPGTAGDSWWWDAAE